MTNTPESNATALAYLSEYCDLSRVRDFAVLLDGPWGAGKTYFIKEFLRQHPRHLYVSLYGISSAQQIDDELFRQLHPVLSSGTMQLLGRVAKGLLKGTVKIDLDGDGKDDGSVTVGMPDLGLKKEMSNPEGRLLVFDDLERCSLPVSEVLGYINAFVEHVGLKAIIIANQNEILRRNSEEGSKDKRYPDIKEKLIGQTLKITSTVEGAYKSFVENINNIKVKTFLISHETDVISIHRQSQTDNLRLLKQALWDYERLAQYFEDEHWKDVEAMRSVLNLVLAVSIEHRCGRLLDHSQIRRLLDSGLLRAMARQSGKDKGVEDEIEERYRTVTFDGSVLNERVVADAVIYGRVVASEVVASLKQSRKFARADEIPLWLKAWDYFDLADDDADKVATEFMKGFNRRVFIERGIVFHAFGILRKYAELGLIELHVEEVLLACRAYVDDLAQSGQIEIDLERSPFLESNDSYAHYGFMSIETSEFIEAVAYYRAKGAEIIESKYPEFMDELLSDLEMGGNKFLLDLAHNNAHYSRFADKPILLAISPEEFLSRVLQMAPRKQRDVFSTLKLRHQYPSGDALAREKPWLAELHNLLTAKISEARPVTCQRLRHLLVDSLDPIAKP
jgi:hypothetical protein